MKKYIRPADLILIGGLILLSLASLLLLRGGAGEVVTVKQGDKILYEGDLSEDARIVAEGAYRNVIRVENGAVFVAESDCPGGDCIHQGEISRGGQRIACAPNGVIISVSGEAESEVDIVAG